MKALFPSKLISITIFSMFMIFSLVLVMARAVTIPNNSGGNPFYLWAYGNTEGITHMCIGTDYGYQGDAALEIFQH
ncbi:hypothetical protein [Algoriphagus namhaensis]